MNNLWNELFEEEKEKGVLIAHNGNWDVYYNPETDSAISYAVVEGCDSSFWGTNCKQYIKKLVRKGYMRVLPEYAEMFA